MHLLLAVIGVGALSAATTAWWIRRAIHRQVMDAPERRRLHQLPTPRGGGIGPVLAIMAMLAVGAMNGASPLGIFVWPLCAGVLAVAAISFADDHRALSIRIRLAVHVLAAVMLAVAHLVATDATPATWTECFLAIVLLATASMNLHNFMDGSDAFLASQTLFVFAALAGLAVQADVRELAATFAMAAVAVAAFLPFNWPRARVFLGDVGSVSFGFLIAAFSLVAIARGVIGWGGALILSSGFMIDATATLFGRVRRTRHWLKPHRDHLYQWLRRLGWSPLQVVAAWQGWNLIVVVPALLWLSRHAASPMGEFGVAIVVHVIGFVLWGVARRALRRAHRAQYRP